MKDSIEFNRPVDVVRLGPDGASYDIAASAEERAALARRFDLLALDHLSAQVTLKPVAGGFYRLAATLEAALTQACVATLEPVTSRVEETFSLLYGALEAQKEVLLDGESETVEPLEGGMIDIGEAVAQQLSLARCRCAVANGRGGLVTARLAVRRAREAASDAGGLSASPTRLPARPFLGSYLRLIPGLVKDFLHGRSEKEDLEIPPQYAPRASCFAGFELCRMLQLRRDEASASHLCRLRSLRRPRGDAGRGRERVIIRGGGAQA